MSEQFTGYVKIKDGNKGPLDYSPNREVEVSISFSTDTRGDLDGITREAAKVADDVVNEKLGRSAEPAKTPTTRKTKPPTADKAVVLTGPETPHKLPEKAKVEADPAGMGEGVTVIPATSGQAISTGGERNDPAAMGGEKKEDGLGDLLGPQAPAPVTDQHLMAAITRRNSETGQTNAHGIRSLILQYVPQDGKHHQAYEIPAEKRQGFLLELDKIQKVG